MKPEVFAEHVLLELGPIPVTATMVTSAFASLLLVALCWPLGRAVAHEPGPGRHRDDNHGDVILRPAAI